MNEIPPGFGRIVFFRSDSMLGAAVQPEIRLAGQVVGQSQPGGFFYVDAAPGKQTASVSTEASSTLDIQVVAGQTSYVRSAISFGLAVGRVTLSIEGAGAAKAELLSLSYTGTHVPRIGEASAVATPGSPGSAAASPTTTASTTAATIAGSTAATSATRPLKSGDAVVYRITDGLSKVARQATFVVARIEGERIHFAEAGRIETTRGTVERIGSPLAGDMDACSPPGGWGPPEGMTPGMRWNLRFQKDAALQNCGGAFQMRAQMVSDGVMSTAQGDLKVQRIDYQGSASSQGFVYSLEAKVWYSPALGRVVRFESDRAAAAGSRNVPATREVAELAEIRRGPGQP